MLNLKIMKASITNGLLATLAMTTKAEHQPDSRADDDISSKDENSTMTPLDFHVSGGLPMISDASFSLLILIYVSVAFCFVFFMFCWKTTDNRRGKIKGIKRECILMTNGSGSTAAADSKMVIIPPTPTPPIMDQEPCIRVHSNKKVEIQDQDDIRNNVNAKRAFEMQKL